MSSSGRTNIVPRGGVGDEPAVPEMVEGSDGEVLTIGCRAIDVALEAVGVPVAKTLDGVYVGAKAGSPCGGTTAEGVASRKRGALFQIGRDQRGERRLVGRAGGGKTRVGAEPESAAEMRTRLESAAETKRNSVGGAKPESAAETVAPREVGAGEGGARRCGAGNTWTVGSAGAEGQMGLFQIDGVIGPAQKISDLH
ncbi:uncharacterized protein UBRO_20291 [Ustilago bromivora]|uniref:Uncharacterized protein n=1 Tax=Ustilago bromivora TaxID=307758 RepID=A0A1K0HFK7_9BASI|nr:uncharacterized protein UBRO_20291 [Ustilago bromivora]